MTIMRIRVLGEPVLRGETRPVERFDAALRRLSEDMFETMYDAPGVGLAATQVGLATRFFVYDDGQGNVGAVANPELLDLEEEQHLEEGCLSIPGLYFPTTRALRVRLRGQGLKGRPLELVAEGQLARIFLHETDHLDGILYIDRLDGETRREALRAIRDLELGAPDVR